MSCIIPPQRFLPPGGDIPTGLLGQVERRAECRSCAGGHCLSAPKSRSLFKEGKEKKKKATLSLAGCVCSEADLLTPGRRARAAWCSCCTEREFVPVRAELPTAPRRGHGGRGMLQVKDLGSSRTTSGWEGWEGTTSLRNTCYCQR